MGEQALIDRGERVGLSGACTALKRDGARCRASAMKGSEWCYNHDPSTSDQRKRHASKGGRVGGRGRAARSTHEVVELRQKIQQLAKDVLEGQVEVGVGAVVNQLYNTCLRALEQERRNRETDELAEQVEEIMKRTQA
jgi:hypothetical protein